MNLSMSYVFSFEKLNVWKESKDLVVTVYQSTKQFPNDEKFGLVSQIRRSAISIVSNLAEGSSRLSYKDKGHFYQLAFSSLMELTAQLDISKELKYISKDELDSIRLQISKIANKINALHRSTNQAIKDQ
jgi:four helix bundle protein